MLISEPAREPEGAAEEVDSEDAGRASEAIGTPKNSREIDILGKFQSF